MMGHFSVTENNLQQNSLKHNNLLKDRLQLAKSGKAKRRPTKALSQDKLDAKGNYLKSLLCGMGALLSRLIEQVQGQELPFYHPRLPSCLGQILTDCKGVESTFCFGIQDHQNRYFLLYPICGTL